MAKLPKMSGNVIGAVMLGDKELLKQLRDFTMVATKGVSQAIHRQAEKLARGIRVHPFVSKHPSLRKAVQVGRYKQRGPFIGSFVRIDYDVATENISGNWDGKRWLTMVWEFGNQHQAGQRFCTNTFLRLRKNMMSNMRSDIRIAVLKKAKFINDRVAREVKAGLRG